jgi:glycosyltransferase involved in cell wall biosynthesis/Tfp pilus assembly protein PilF
MSRPELTTRIQAVKLTACSLNLGELHHPRDIGFFRPVFQCVTEKGEHFAASMRLHVTEPLDSLMIADPRAFPDGGMAVNSAGSRVLIRRSSYDAPNHGSEPVPLPEELNGAMLFRIPQEEMRRAVLNGYDHPRAVSNPARARKPEIAFTSHDPGVIGGGNTILFRFINWLSDLGVKVTIYSCGRYPYWTRVNARVRLFSSYRSMCEAIEEDTVVLYSMWHIESMLQAQPEGKSIYHLRQIYEAFHYGTDYQSMTAAKPVIALLESLPIGVISISPHLAEWYSKKHHCESLLITNGISPRTFWPSAESKRNAKVCRIVSVGDPRHFVKGADVLMKALCRLAGKLPHQKFEWILASGGHGELPDLKSTFPANLNFVVKNGLRATDMRVLYQSATVVVNPSLYEGFGLPTLEAMACGAPVVHADNRGLDTIVEHEKDCLVVPVNDPDATAIAIERILRDGQLAARLSAAGLETARRYTTLHQFDHFVPAFEQMLGTQFSPEKVARVREPLERESNPEGRPLFRPLVSVVMPSYNQASYLRQSLDSLLAQTYTNWEAVVMNDGSTDNTVEVMEEYAAKDPRIRPFTKPNGGITSALKAGLEKAQGDFFCWLSSDDLFYPEKLEWQVKAFEQLDDSYALVYGSFDILENETGRVVAQPFQEPLTPGAEFPEALKFDFIEGTTIMIRMSVMREVGGFNPYYRHSQDMELWVRIASRGYRFQQLERKVSIRRVHAAQASTGNMIHCRYDAACIINYYLDRFHFLETYRYFDSTPGEGLNKLLFHLVGRMTHTEANVNHPLLQEKFWKWILRGIRALPVENQCAVLRALMRLLQGQRGSTRKMEYYLAACADALNEPVELVRFDPVYNVEGRDIRQDTRETDAFAGSLFDYGCDLLVNAHTPLVAQEMYYHNTHKVVDTPYKLGHSIFRYLSQFANPYRARVAPFAKLTDIPATRSEAMDLFCRLRYPELADAMRASMAFNAAGVRDLYEIAAVEEQIANMPAEYAEDLLRVCDKNPTETILFYWLGLVAVAHSRYAEAAELGWKTLTVGQRSCDWRIAYRMGEWAERAGNLEQANAAFGMASNANPAFREATDAVARVLRAHPRFIQRTPVPNGFINTKDVYTIPDAELTSCTVYPRQDGTFDLACGARAQGSPDFHARARLPYAPEFEPQVITDPATGNHYKITAGTLYRFWSSGYDFNRESRRYMTGLLQNPAPPRVAFTVLNGSVRGGGTGILYRFVNWLAELGVEVSIYSNDPAPDWIKLRAVYHHIENADQRYSAITEPVVLVYSVLEMPLVLRSCPKEGKRILHFSQVVEDFNYHGAEVDSLMAPKAIMQILQSLPVGRVAISDHIQQYFRKEYGQDSYRIVNGIDLTTWKKGPVAPVTVRKSILTAGNPARRMKGTADVRQAVALLAGRHPEWKINLIIASGERVNGYSTDTTSLGFTTTLYCGLTAEEMRERYCVADVYVNAAWYEGFGLPSIEAMACGVPVVQANNAGLDGIIRHGQNCLVVKPGDPGEIADALEKILTDAPLRQQLISNGSQTASSLGVTRQFDMFVPAFEDLLGVRFDRSTVASLRETLDRGTPEKRVKEAVAGMVPLFSVLVPVYNQAKFLAAALNSLLAQSYHNWEAVVVNDGSTDETAQLLEQYAGLDARIKPYHKANGGTASALNYALRHAQGEWICWLSSDDLFRPEKLAIHAGEIEQNPEVKFFHTHYYTLDGQSGKVAALSPELASLMPVAEDRVISFMHTNYINGITVCIHRGVFDDVGWFNESYRWGQDHDLWLRMAVRHAPKFLPARTAVYRQHVAQDSHAFPEAGSFDSARAAVAFLNEHHFPDLFPSLALQDPEEIFTAVKKALSVAAHPGSFLNQLGCGRALVDRLHEWLSHTCPLAPRPVIHAQLLRVIDDAQNSSSDTRVKAAFASLKNAGGDLFRYVPVDPLAEAEAYAAECESEGRTDKANALRKYLEKVGRSTGSASGSDSLEACHALFSSGRFEEACQRADEIEQSMAAAGIDETTIPVLENLRLFRGYCLLELQELDDAKAAFQAALEVNPVSSRACAGLGTVFFQGGLTEAAKTMFEWGVKNDPANQQAVQGLLEVNRGLGLPDTHSSLNDVPPSPTEKSMEDVLGEAYRQFEAKQFEDALRTVESAEELIDAKLPDEDRGVIVAAIENFRGHVYLTLGDLENAKEHFESGLKANPQSSQACAGLGEVFHLSGNHSAAKTMYEWAVKCDRGSAAAIQGLAKVNAGAGLPGDHNTLFNAEHEQVSENA